VRRRLVVHAPAAVGKRQLASLDQPAGERLRAVVKLAPPALKKACSMYTNLRAGLRVRARTTLWRMPLTLAYWIELLLPEKYWSMVLSQPTSSCV